MGLGTFLSEKPLELTFSGYFFYNLEAALLLTLGGIGFLKFYTSLKGSDFLCLTFFEGADVASRSTFSKLSFFLT